MKALLSVFALMATICLASAQESKNVFTYPFGDMKIILLSEGQSNGNKGILIGATGEMLSRYAPGGTFPNATNAFLIQTGRQNILIDTGFGRNLFDNLASAGVKPEEIDIILLTHMHGDHIGGFLRDGKKAFPNAKLYIADIEHDYWIKQENEGAAEVINAYKDALTLFQPAKIGEAKAGAEIFAGIAAYGHTPGHVAFMIYSRGKEFLVWGDLTHAMAVQMPYPCVAVTYDVDPELAIKYRQEILDYVSENNVPVAGMHIAYPGMGTVRKQGEGYHFAPFK